jgi:hypothetical protein
MSSKGPSRTIPLWKKRGFDNANDYCADLVSVVVMIFFLPRSQKMPFNSTTHVTYHAATAPLQLFNNRALGVEEAIALTGASLKPNSMWRTVSRRKKKQDAAGKSAPLTIDVA